MNYYHGRTFSWHHCHRQWFYQPINDRPLRVGGGESGLEVRLDAWIVEQGQEHEGIILAVSMELFCHGLAQIYTDFLNTFSARIREIHGKGFKTG
jgi:hypothetical protein